MNEAARIEGTGDDVTDHIRNAKRRAASNDVKFQLDAMAAPGNTGKQKKVSKIIHSWGSHNGVQQLPGIVRNLTLVGLQHCLCTHTHTHTHPVSYTHLTLPTSVYV